MTTTTIFPKPVKVSLCRAHGIAEVESQKQRLKDQGEEEAKEQQEAMSIHER